MALTVTTTDLARTLGDVLARVRYGRESFVVERKGIPIARIVPIETTDGPTLAEALAAWCAAAPAEPTFADDLERVNAGDRPAQSMGLVIDYRAPSSLPNDALLGHCAEK